MTVLRTPRLPSLALALVLLLAAMPMAAGDPLPDPPSPSEVVGSVPFPVLGCLGCIGGGVYLAASGWGAVVFAASRRGSALALLTCGALCRRAVSL